MTPSEILALLRKAEGSSRFIDKEIALLMGWQRRIDGNGMPEWFRGDTERGMPFYTRSVQAAKDFLYEIAPNAAAACVWDNNMGAVVVDGYNICDSSEPAAALCIATLTIMEHSIGSVRQDHE